MTDVTGQMGLYFKCVNYIFLLILYPPETILTFERSMIILEDIIRKKGQIRLRSYILEKLKLIL